MIEYILQLRHHVRRGNRPTSTTREGFHRHLDQVAYWKSRFENASQRCQDLERRVVQLEKSRTSDAADADSDLIFETDSEQSVPKRKKGGAKSARPSKRAKCASPRATPGPSSKPAESGIGTRGTSEATTPQHVPLDAVSKAKEELVVKLFVTYNHYRQEATLEVICHSLIETTRAIGTMVSLILEHHDRLAFGGNAESLTTAEIGRLELSSAVQACTRAWASVLVGLKKLSDGPDTHLPNFVVVECVNMFSTVFRSISDCAREIANARPSDRSRGNASRVESNPTSRDTAPFRSAAQFLNALISSLNKDDHQHRDIFEGVMFLLIERIGSTLFYFTFGHHRNRTIEGDIAMSTTIDNETEVTGNPEEVSMRLEAQCLTAVLERAMGLAPYHMNTPFQLRPGSATSRRPSSATRTPTTRTLPRASAVPLVAHARDRLQRTLLRSMFGEGQEDELSDVLRKPGRLGAMPKISKVEDKDVGRWYNGEIWRLLGWDIISRDSESCDG